jgi:DNA anti-recombination protein RmuC
MPPGIDESSFTLGKLTGQIEDLLHEVKEVKKDVSEIKKALNHQKVKQAGLSATVALIFSIVYAYFMERFKTS